jgi:hypothetical protein
VRITIPRAAHQMNLMNQPAFETALVIFLVE